MYEIPGRQDDRQKTLNKRFFFKAFETMEFENFTSTRVQTLILFETRP